MPAQVPNTSNNPQLTANQTADANAAIKNFIKGVTWPPVTNNDRIKMKAAIDAFKAQLNNLKKQSAKKAKGGAAAPPAAQIAAQQNNVGNEVPGLASFLPAGTDLNNTSFSNAIASIQNTVSQMESLVKNPAGAALGGGGREFGVNTNVKAV